MTTSGSDALPFSGGPFRLTMGVRGLDPAEWIDLDPETLDEQLVTKRELLASRRDDVVVTLPDRVAAEASEELEQAVVEWWTNDPRPAPAEPDPS